MKYTREKRIRCTLFETRRIKRREKTSTTKEQRAFFFFFFVRGKGNRKYGDLNVERIRRIERIKSPLSVGPENRGGKVEGRIGKENITRELAPFLLVDPSLPNFTTQ